MLWSFTWSCRVAPSFHAFETEQALRIFAGARVVRLPNDPLQSLVTITRYNLLLTGKTLPGRDRDAAVAALARMLHLSKAAAEELLNGREVMVERNIDKSLLIRYEAALDAAGVANRAEPCAAFGPPAYDPASREARISELAALAREVNAAKPDDIAFQNINLAWAKRVLRERPFALVAFLSLAGSFFILRVSNTFSIGQLMAPAMTVGAGVGFVLALVMVVRDSSFSERHPMLFGMRNAVFYAIEAAAVAGMAAIVLAALTNRWIPGGAWEWRVLQVEGAYHETGRNAVSSTAFIDAGRCCLSLTGTDYGAEGTLIEFRMRRGVLGAWVYSDFRPVAASR